MKRILPIALGVLSLVVLADAKPRKQSPPIILTEADTLYIEVMDSVNYSHHDVGDRDRFYLFREALEEVLEELGFPIEYKISRWGARRNPPGEPELLFVIHKWGSDGLGQIEARFQTVLRKEGDKNNLGITRERDSMVFSSYERVRNAHKAVLRKGLVKVITGLGDRFEYERLEQVEIGTDLEEAAND